MFTIESASNPKYMSIDGTSIHLNVKFVEFNQVLPFLAIPTDSMAHGVELYNRAKAGEFGVVASYVAPLQPKSTGLKTA